MWDEGNGIYVEISQFGGQPIYMYRSIRHMRDCSGGPNHYEILARKPSTLVVG